MHHPVAPDLITSQWFGTDRPLRLVDFQGKVVVLEAFQMLCPSCVTHGLPLMKEVRRTFREEDVAVIGLHTVFEHHDVMNPAALKAFIHEYRIDYPVAVDSPAINGDTPQTMAAYRMRGTPTTVLIDRQGNLREQMFGAVSGLALGAKIGMLLNEEAVGCNEQGCEPRRGI